MLQMLFQMLIKKDLVEEVVLEFGDPGVIARAALPSVGHEHRPSVAIEISSENTKGAYRSVQTNNRCPTTYKCSL